LGLDVILDFPGLTKKQVGLQCHHTKRDQARITIPLTYIGLAKGGRKRKGRIQAEKGRKSLSNFHTLLETRRGRGGTILTD